jgi:hypothetical protein
MLGHASAAMTLDVYSGLFDDDLGALADRMDAAARAAAENLWAPCGRGHRPARRLTANALFRVVGPVRSNPQPAD